LLLAEIIENSKSLLLFLLAVEFHQRNTRSHFLEGLVNKADLGEKKKRTICENKERKK